MRSRIYLYKTYHKNIQTPVGWLTFSQRTIPSHSKTTLVKKEEIKDYINRLFPANATRWNYAEK